MAKRTIEEEQRWIECGSGCVKGHTERWPYCERGTDPIEALDPLERKVADAFRADRVRTMSDGDLSIIIGDPISNAKLAVRVMREALAEAPGEQR